MTDILPAIIVKKFSDLEPEINRVKDFVDLVHVDISDGIFTHSKTWPYIGDNGEFARLLREEMGLPAWDDIDYEFHLMIQKPEESVEQWITAGASSIVVHAEATDKIEEIIKICKASEVSIGVALKASTDISVIELYVSELDFVQCMGSDDLGHHNANFDEHVYQKIKDLREKYPELAIAVDIGVDRDSAPKLVEAGATKLVAGHAIFQSQDSAEAIEYFRNL